MIIFMLKILIFFLNLVKFVIIVFNVIHVKYEFENPFLKSI